MKTFSRLNGAPNSRCIESHTEQPVIADVFLKIRTSKVNGYITSRASAYHAEDDGFESHYLYKDFVAIAARSPKQATAKNIQACHDDALSRKDEWITACLKHYTVEE